MIEVLKQALEALEYFDERAATINEIQMARPVLLHLRQAIKELESQEPPQRTEPVIDKSAAKRIATALGWTPPLKENT